MIISSIVLLMSSGCSALAIVSSSSSHVTTTATTTRSTTRILRSLPTTLYSMRDETAAGNSDSACSIDDENNNNKMVWTEWQDWALCDNLPKYLVVIPPSEVVAPRGGRRQQFARWRSMIQDVPELSGYNVAFVRQKYAQQQQQKLRNIVDDVPALLPLIEQFEFEPNDGISGTVYGFPGIADGTRVTTPPLRHVHQTIPLGYVYSQEEEDGHLTAYEIGSPSQQRLSAIMAMEAAASSTSIYGRAARPQMEATTTESTSWNERIQNYAPFPKQLATDNNINSAEVGNLASITAIVLAGATAVNVLSHHVTVNLFWV